MMLTDIVEALSSATDGQIKDMVERLEMMDKLRLWRIIGECKRRGFW